ncbi:hypothetical protein BGX27_006951 [Mortierella sp. AM989]|nr:hypothetical protein BGX27_006951 [Mortierella sp. AM989]
MPSISKSSIPQPPPPPVNRGYKPTYRLKIASDACQDNIKASSRITDPNPCISIADQYKQVVLDVCMSAYHSVVDNQAKATLSYIKDDRLAVCHTISPLGNGINLKECLTSMIPDPDLRHPVSRRVAPEIIRYFRDFTSERPYSATTACHLSYRSKLLMETLNFHHAIPKPYQAATISDVNLAAAFMRSTACGPIEASSFDRCHYEWASQYQAVRALSGIGKSDSAISFRKENAKSLETMHSQVSIYKSMVTDRDIHADPVLGEKIYSYATAFMSDSDWLEAQDQEHENSGQYWKVIEHCRVSNKGLNAVLGFEKICGAEWKKRDQLIQPAWFCTLNPDERQRLMFATCYGEYSVNSESHRDLTEVEGLRSRVRLRSMIMGCHFDSYDEWASGETNISSLLCSDCTTAEIRAACSPSSWDSEEYDYTDRWQYAPMGYFFYSARHNCTMTRLLRFQAHDVEDVLKSYGHGPKTDEENFSCGLMATIVSDIGIEIQSNEVGDRIAQSYDWVKISGMCAHCSQDGGASEWYLATFGASLTATQLSILEKVRLGMYLDSAGFNVFPRLHRSYISGCGCVGRWIKRMGILMTRTSNLWTPANYSSAFAIRDAMASSIDGLDNDAIALFLNQVNEEVQRGRQAGKAYREHKEALLWQK